MAERMMQNEGGTGAADPSHDQTDEPRGHAPWKLVLLSFALPALVVGGLLVTEWVRAGATERANAVILNNGRWVDLHAGPGTAFRMLDTIPDGTAVAVVCVAMSEGESGEELRWAKLDNGAWVQEAFVFVEGGRVDDMCDSIPGSEDGSAPPDELSPDQAEVRATIDTGGNSRLNKRSGPGTSFDRLGHLADGDEVVIICNGAR